MTSSKILPDTAVPIRPEASHAFLSGGGATGTLIRAHDWSATPLGTPESWPQPLRTLVGIMLGSKQPMFIAWGPDRTLLYNDAYSEILAGKHPAAMGRDFLEVWHEIRADLLPIVEQAYGGEPVHMDDITLMMKRRGYLEEAHFSFSYTPVRDETGAVAGFFCPCTETTGQVLAERRLRESEARFRAVQETSIDGFMVLEAVRDEAGRLVDFRWVYANEAAERIIERVRAGSPSDRLPEPLSELQFTFSAGVTEALPQDDRSSILCRADHALYTAKGEGRNCTRIGVAAEGEPPRQRCANGTDWT